MVHQYYREPGYKDLYPTDALVAKVLNTGGGASEAEVIECLECPYLERGLKPGTRNGPKHW